MTEEQGRLLSDLRVEMAKTSVQSEHQEARIGRIEACIESLRIQFTILDKKVLVMSTVGALAGTGLGWAANMLFFNN